VIVSYRLGFVLFFPLGFLNLFVVRKYLLFTFL